MIRPVTEAIFTDEATGVRWLVRIIDPVPLGLGAPDSEVEFYDFDQSHHDFGERGQLVASYQMNDIVGDLHGVVTFTAASADLKLNKAIPRWTIKSDTAEKIHAWICQ